MSGQMPLACNQQQIRAQLRDARLDWLQAQHRYLAAIKEAERLVYRKDQPIFHQRQAG